jgi:hypothetical protein
VSVLTELEQLRAKVAALETRKGPDAAAMAAEVRSQLAVRMRNLPAELIESLRPMIADIADLEAAVRRQQEAHRADLAAVKAAAGAAAMEASNAAAAGIAAAKAHLVGHCAQLVNGDPIDGD